MPTNVIFKYLEKIENKLIFYYDNTPHFPNLKNFSHHKHLPDEIIDAAKPTVIDTIQEIQSYFMK